MRNLAARTSPISAAALAAALAWGVLEVIALQWSRLLERTSQRRAAGPGPSR